MIIATYAPVINERSLPRNMEITVGPQRKNGSRGRHREIPRDFLDFRDYHMDYDVYLCGTNDAPWTLPGDSD
jgi:hypothetical protein